MHVKNKVAIVTGASSGIGLATAKLLAKHGAKVALVVRSKDKLEKLAKTLPDAMAVQTDMTNIQDIKTMIAKVKKHYGTIDILVNNAGQGYDATVVNIDIPTFRKVFDLDVVGPLAAMQEVIPLMKKQKGGAIVNISSGTALMALPGMAAYSSLKRALAGISLTAREELTPDNISVTVVYPYITDTDFEKNTIKHGSGEDSDAGGGPPFPADSPEHVAEIILEAITGGKAELYAHEWMNPAKK